MPRILLLLNVIYVNLRKIFDNTATFINIVGNSEILQAEVS